MRTRFAIGLGGAALVVAWSAAPASAANANGRVDVVALDSFHVISSESGSVNYYHLVGGDEPHWHAAYKPPWDTAVLGYQLPDGERRSVAKIRWKWRAVTLPDGGDECVSAKADSAAVVYVTWRRGLKWYSLKYVWSAVGRKGTTCDKKRNPFRAQDTIIVDSGPPLGQWRTVEIDPDAEFRNHFEGGDSHADVPDLLGLGVMSDGDQTSSPSSADYAGFAFVLK